MKRNHPNWFLPLALIGLLFAGRPGLAQRTATGTPVVYFGFIVDVEVTDPGAGYVAVPLVSITGGGGSGAIAVAAITNGAVSDIIMLDAGFGYTNAPTVVISPPPRNTTLSLRLAPLLVVEGEPYAQTTIQWADALGDTNQWFTITNVVLGSNAFLWCDTEAAQSTRRFYRAVVLPPPANPDPALLVWIPPGTFLMGSPDTEQDRQATEGPVTQVRLVNGFFMRKFEVTQGEYVPLMAGNPSYYSGDTNLPVDQVNWYEATNFCGRLTAREQAAGRVPAGWAYRLPTEAEWEYACRAGTTNRFSFGDDPAGNLFGLYGWYNANSGHTHHPVGSKLPNPWGLYDMHGNVYEWCLDWMGTYPGGSLIEQPSEVSGTLHAIRGGSWENGGADTRSASRIGVGPDFIYWSLGFRPVLAPIP